MPAKRITMRKLRDVLRLRLSGGLSIREISRSTKLSVGGIQKLLSRYHGNPVMLGKLLVAGVEVRVIAAGFADAAFEVVWDHQRRYAAKVFQGVYMAFQPVGQ